MKQVLGILSLFILLIACGNSKRTEQLSDIKKSETALLANMAKLDLSTAQDLLKKYDGFVAAYPKDTASATILFKSADIARGIGEYGKAIKYWGDMREFFPDNRLTSDAMFLQAFTYENDLEDKDNAKRYYQKFIEKYPNHEFIDDAKMALQKIDVPVEELVKQFEQNLKK